MASDARVTIDEQRRRSENGERDNKKRKHHESSADSESGMSQPPTKIRQIDLPEHNLTSVRRRSYDSGSTYEKDGEDRRSSQEWQHVEHGHKKKGKKIPKPQSSNYPGIDFSSNSRLNAPIRLSDLQNLILYILADGPTPQFVSVRHRPEIRKVVAIMVPGLDMSMFGAKALDVTDRKEEAREKNGRIYTSPDQYYPVRLYPEDLPGGVRAFADMFPHVWPVKTPGDDRFAKMHSPLHAMLTAPQTKTREEKKADKNRKGVQTVREPQGWSNTRTPIPEFIHSAEDLLENDYTLHPALYNNEQERIVLSAHRQASGCSEQDGWVDTKVIDFIDGTPPDREIESGSLTAGREVLAMDCEMCMTGESEFSLTRISIVAWDGSVVLDELVKPDKPITNYLTQYSGITEKMLESVTTRLPDIQKKLLGILTPRTILIGHSLNSDLTALKITHPFIIDTALVYPHPRGPPLKSSLKWLAQKYLNREIQKGHGTSGPGAGHDSIEDARTCLDLVKQKCEKGKAWGMGDSQGENIFRRVARTGVKYKNQGNSAIPSPLSGKSSAAIDWGDPKKGPGGGATFAIGCASDEDVVQGIIRAANGDHDGKEIPGGGVDFVWARMRELEALKGWWNNNKVANAQAAAATTVDVESAEEGITSFIGMAAKSDEGQKPILKPADQAANKVELEGFAEDVKDIKTFIPTNTALPPPVHLDPSTSIETAIAKLTERISKIYDALPPCTAFILYSGSGDPREMSRLQAMQAQFKREYKIKKWDELSVRWTDVEEQALKRAASVARDGIGFMTVK